MYSGVLVSVGEFGPPVMQIHCLPAGTWGNGVSLPFLISTVDAQLYLPATEAFVVPPGPVGSVCCLVQSIGWIMPSASKLVSWLSESMTFCCEKLGPASLSPVTSSSASIQP